MRRSTTMAEGQRMTAADVVAQVRDGRLEDFVREAVVLVARELMEAEISEQVGAEHGEVAPEGRVTHRNGYRPRPWETRVGEIELLIPGVRQGSYFRSFLERGAARVQGMTKDRVSAMCRGLDEQVELFRQRPLDGAYPYLWLDAKHVKVRDRANASVMCSSAWRRSCRRCAGSSKTPRRTSSPLPAALRALDQAPLHQPLERVNTEIGRRSDVVGIFPNDASVIRLAGALLSEQNDEWLVQRRYLSVESMALILAARRIEESSPPRQPSQKEAVALNAA
jgi:transposase-like protein